MLYFAPVGIIVALFISRFFPLSPLSRVISPSGSENQIVVSVPSPSIGKPYAVASGTKGSWSWVDIPSGPLCQSTIYQRVGGTIHFDGGYHCASGYIVPASNPTTFRQLEIDGVEQAYGTDGKNVFAGAMTLDGADPHSLVPIYDASGTLEFMKDAAHVFYGSNTVVGADPATFSYLGEVSSGEFELGVYAMDNRHVYYAGHGANDPFQMVRGADINTFHLLGNDLAPIGLIPVHTSKPCGYSCDYDAQDQTGIYYNGFRL